MSDRVNTNGSEGQQQIAIEGRKRSIKELLPKNHRHKAEWRDGGMRGSLTLALDNNS